MIRRNVRRGFTLVELMVVLAILVLLVAMVGPRLLGSQKKADVKATMQQISNLESCLQLYAVDNRTFPTTEEGMGLLLNRPADEMRSVNWDGPYLEADALPRDPWGRPYQYEFPPTRGRRNDTPVIWSLGPDGQDSTEDDITSWTKTGPNEAEGDVLSPELTAESPGTGAARLE